MKLIESRIASDLKINLSFLRDTVERKYEDRLTKASKEIKQSSSMGSSTGRSSSSSISTTSSSVNSVSVSSVSVSSSSSNDKVELDVSEVKDEGMFSR